MESESISAVTLCMEETRPSGGHIADADPIASATGLPSGADPMQGDSQVSRSSAQWVPSSLQDWMIIISVLFVLSVCVRVACCTRVGGRGGESHRIRPHRVHLSEEVRTMCSICAER